MGNPPRSIASWHFITFSHMSHWFVFLRFHYCPIFSHMFSICSLSALPCSHNFPLLLQYVLRWNGIVFHLFPRSSHVSWYFSFVSTFWPIELAIDPHVWLNVVPDARPGSICCSCWSLVAWSRTNRCESTCAQCSRCRLLVGVSLWITLSGEPTALWTSSKPCNSMIEPLSEQSSKWWCVSRSDVSGEGGD